MNVMMAFAVVLSVATSVLTQSGTEQRPTVSARVDRPAMFVADRITYTIEILCPRGVDILVGDLHRDKLRLTALDVVSADSRRREDSGGTRYWFDYVLTTYRVDVATPTIESWPVRYYLTRAGQRAGDADAAPAGTIVVPAVVVAFRSLLPEDQPIDDVRDGRSVPPPWLRYGVLEGVGIGLILLSVTPAALLLVRLANGARARWRVASRRSARHAAQMARTALEELRAADPVDAGSRREGFARLDALLRQHLTEVCGIPAASLTPDEIEGALAPCAGRISVELVRSILASCELARYANPERHPSTDAWREALGHAEQILGGR